MAVRNVEELESARAEKKVEERGGEVLLLLLLLVVFCFVCKQEHNSEHATNTKLKEKRIEVYMYEALLYN